MCVDVLIYVYVGEVGMGAGRVVVGAGGGALVEEVVKEHCLRYYYY